MDANTRHFEAEIEAQYLENEQEQTRVHAEAEVAAVTAL